MFEGPNEKLNSERETWMSNGKKCWLLIEQEDTGEKEPDGRGGWVPKVITRVLAGTENPEAINAALSSLRDFVEKQGCTETLIRTGQVILSPKLLEIAQNPLTNDNGTGSAILDEFLKG